MKAPIPVIQLIDGFATEEHSGGAAQFALRLALQFDREHVQPHVVGLWRYGTASEQRWLTTLAEHAIPTTILIEHPTRLAADLGRASAYLHQIIVRSGIQIVNSHFERGDLLAMAAKIQSIGRLRIIRTQHTDQQWQKRPWLGALLNIAAFPWLFDKEVAISATTRDVLNSRITSQLLRRESALIYNGLSQQAMKDFAQKRGRVGFQDNNKKCLAIIGRLAPQKGHHDLFQAFTAVLHTEPNVELLVIGDGELDHELRAMAQQLGITSAVRFLGQRTDISELLAQIDVLISASLWEGFPTVILEAMAAGVPVIATNVSGSRELVQNGKTGVLVSPGSPQQIALAIIQLLHQQEQATTFAQNAQHGVNQYSLESTVGLYNRLYKALTNTVEGN